MTRHTYHMLLGTKKQTASSIKCYASLRAEHITLHPLAGQSSLITHLSNLGAREEPRSSISMRQDSLDIDVRLGTLRPELDENVSTRTRPKKINQ